MSAVDRSTTSGGALIAATLWLMPTSAGAFDSVAVLVPPAAPNHAPLGASGDDRIVDALPRVEVTRLAATKTARDGVVLQSLYRRLTMVALAQRCRIVRFVLSGEQLADAPSDDVSLEVYVEGLDGDAARLDLWEVLSVEVGLAAEATPSHLLSERLGLVVRKANP